MTPPTVPPTLLTPRFVALVSGVTLYFLGLNMTLSVLPLFVEGELGGTDAQVGIAVSSFGLAAACIRPIIGPLGDRHGRQRLIVSGAIVAGLATIALSTDDWPLWIFFGLAVILGIGGNGWVGLFLSEITLLAPDDRAADATSGNQFFMYGGIVAGPAIGSVLVGATDSYPVLFLTFAGFAALAGVGLYFVTRRT